MCNICFVPATHATEGLSSSKGLASAEDTTQH